MFKKENRLSTNFEFNITKKYGTKLFSRYFTLYYLKPNKYQGPSKIGIVVSTKLHKKAVKRNWIKRIFRETIRQKLDKIPSDLWIAIYPKRICLEKTYEEISTDINKVLPKISLS